jgi:hypothetical protein
MAALIVRFAPSLTGPEMEKLLPLIGRAKTEARLRGLTA